MKKSNRNLLCMTSVCAALLALNVQPAFSAETPGVSTTQQSHAIQGTVTDGNEPIIGASVMVKGKNQGAVTDMDGHFSIDVPPGTELVISYLGYQPKTVKAAADMKVTLSEDSKNLKEIVVTALGIKRDRKALGYGLSEIKGEELTKAKETNVINSLAGKVAGLVVQNTAGGASGSTRVLLRGNTEMTGNNQPLYVVDGVPLDNTNFGSAGQAGGYDLGDGISAINPDDIETMTVLKGPAASALYGSRASHGVILITTKKAAKDKVSVEYNGSITMDKQLAKWDNIQQVYGMGNGGQYLETTTSGTNMSWGPKADDYLVKPFEFAELLARLRALGRRSTQKIQQDIIEVGGYTLNRTAKVLKKDDQVIQLSPREFQIFDLLAQNLGIVVPRDIILDRIWGLESDVSSNNIDSYMKILRKKLDTGDGKNLIKTVRGVGYKLEADD